MQVVIVGVTQFRQLKMVGEPPKKSVGGWEEGPKGLPEITVAQLGGGISPRKGHLKKFNRRDGA